MKYITYRKDRNCYQVCFKVEKRAITKTCKTEEEAIAARDALLAQYAKGKTLFKALHHRTDTESLTLEEAYSSYVTDVVAKKGLTPSALYKYYQSERIINPILGKHKIDDIVPSIWQAAFDYIQRERGLSYNYTKAIVGRYRNMYDYYIRKEAVESNPLKHIDLQYTRIQPRRVFKEGEKELFMEEAERYDTDFAFMFRILFETAIRRGELLALRWEDIDLANQTIRINKSVSKGTIDNKFTEFVGGTKTRASNRIIPISSYVTNRLKAMNRKSDYVFTLKNSWSKYPWVSLSRIDYVFALIRDRAGLDKRLSIHAIRHYVASRLVSSGVDIKTVQEIGGWAKASTLLDIYAHSNDNLKRLALASIRDGRDGNPDETR